MGKKGRTAEVVVYLQKGLALHPLVLAPRPHIPSSPRRRPPSSRRRPLQSGVGIWHGGRRGVDVELAWASSSSSRWLGVARVGHRRGGVVGVEVEVAWRGLSWSLSRAGRRGR